MIMAEVAEDDSLYEGAAERIDAVSKSSVLYRGAKTDPVISGYWICSLGPDVLNYSLTQQFQ